MAFLAISWLSVRELRMGKTPKKRKAGATIRSISDPFSMTNSHKDIICRDECLNVQKILMEMIEQEKKSMSRRNVTNLNLAQDLLKNVVTHLPSCVPWAERVAYERLKKRQEIKNKLAGASGIKKQLFPEKKKTRKKRKSVMKEDLRRQEDGRAAKLIMYKVREEMKIFFARGKIAVDSKNNWQLT